MRPSLFEHDLFPGARVRSLVNTATIGEMQCLLDPVRQVGSYRVSVRVHRAVTATVTVEVRAVGGA